MAWPKQSETRQWEKPEGDDPRTLYQMMKTSVERFGSTDAFGYIPAPGMSRVNVTYNQLGDLTDAVAKALMDRGVVAGDRIAIIVDNSVEWAVLSYAANAFGAAYTAMYTHQHGSEWSYIINDSTPSLVAIANTGCLDKLVDSHGVTHQNGHRMVLYCLVMNRPTNFLQRELKLSCGQTLLLQEELLKPS